MRRFMFVLIAALLVAAPVSAQQIVPGVNYFRLVDGTAARPSDTYIQDSDTGKYRIGANNEGFSAGGTLRWDYNTTRLKLSSGYTLDWNTTSIDATDIGKIDGITNGTGAAGKALVLDSNADITAGPRNFALTGAFRAGNGTAASPSISLDNDPDTGFYAAEANGIGVSLSGVRRMTFSSLGSYYSLDLGPTGALAMGSALGTMDTYLTRGGAAGKVLLEGTTPMVLMGGTTSSFPAMKRSGADLYLRLADDSGFTQLFASTIVASSANMYANALVLSTGASTSRGFLSSDADGVFRMANAAGNGFTRLIIGTNDASGVALAKNGTTLETKLGDNSAYTTHAAAAFQTTTALVALGGGAAPTLGTIGGSGPATAAQNTWLRMIDSTGAAFWVPAWK